MWFADDPSTWTNFGAPWLLKARTLWRSPGVYEPRPALQVTDCSADEAKEIPVR